METRCTLFRNVVVVYHSITDHVMSQVGGKRNAGAVYTIADVKAADAASTMRTFTATPPTRFGQFGKPTSQVCNGNRCDFRFPPIQLSGSTLMVASPNENVNMPRILQAVLTTFVVRWMRTEML